MASELRFDGKVVLITGAGGALGRSYALNFAQRGASVIVNDLGGDRAGAGKSSSAADKVVEEIKRFGGKAVANYDSVEEAEKLVNCALKSFGRIDIVINNAGILRDRSFGKMSVEDWDIIQKIHLRGSFLVTKAAWPHLQKQKYGRIIFTSSAASFGNFGQTNYSAAKFGLTGLSNSLALEGEKYNIHSNTILPMAISRLTSDVLTSDISQNMKPDYVAPLVCWLCHESCPANGQAFEIGSGCVALIPWARTAGVNLIAEEGAITPELVQKRWSDITNVSHTNFFTRSSELVNLQMKSYLQPRRVIIPYLNSGNQKLDALAKAFESSDKYSYTSLKPILYALSVGMTTQEPNYLKFLYENDPNFSVLPTFGVVMSLSKMSNFVKVFTENSIDFTKFLHGEHYIELMKPLPPSANLVYYSQIVDVLDKGSGAALIQNSEFFDEEGQLLLKQQSVLFLRGEGNFGGKKNSSKLIPTKNFPARFPDAVIKEKIPMEQAALYRLNGDINPIHIDPNLSAMTGFDKPILHGLCVFGYACRHVLKHFTNYDVTKFKAMKVRFSKPVIPGQTLQTEMWQNGTTIFINCKVLETGTVVLSGGYVELVEAPNIQLHSSTTLKAPPTISLKSEAVFEELGKRMASQPDVAKRIQAIYQWNITKDGQTAGQWTLDLKTGQGSIYKGETKGEKPGCTLTLSDDDMVDMVTGKLNAQQAFFKGRLKISGNIMLSQKLSQILQTQAKL